MSRTEVGGLLNPQLGHKVSNYSSRITSSFGKEKIKEKFDTELFNELKDEILNNKLIKKFSGLTR